MENRFGRGLLRRDLLLLGAAAVLAAGTLLGVVRAVLPIVSAGVGTALLAAALTACGCFLGAAVTVALHLCRHREAVAREERESREAQRGGGQP